VLDFEVFIFEHGAVNALATSTVKVCEIATLDHEVWNNSVKNGTFEVPGVTSHSDSPFARAETTEILCRSRNDIAK